MTSCPVLVKRPSGCNVVYVPSKQTANDRESSKMGVYSESQKYLYQRFSIANFERFQSFYKYKFSPCNVHHRRYEF